MPGQAALLKRSRRCATDRYFRAPGVSSRPRTRFSSQRRAPGAESQLVAPSARSGRAMESSRTGAVRTMAGAGMPEAAHRLYRRPRPLAARETGGAGLSAADYLQMMTFVDGSSTRSCRLGRWVLLVARPGSGTVHVCPTFGDPFGSRLADVQLRNPALAESIVIHEMLHTLGLGEDPPTSEAITRQVQLRCGS